MAHGEANYAVFIGVMKKYMELKKDGKIEKLNRFMAGLLGCGAEHVYEELEILLDQIISKKTMKEYGATQEMLRQWSRSVIEGQQRLMVNSFVPLNEALILDIYQSIYE